MSNCVECGRRVVAFNKKLRKIVTPHKDHELCQKCWRIERDRNREIKPNERHL